MPSKPMPVVALGCYRDVAETTNSIFAGTLYYIAAVLDLYSSPPPFAYTKQTLGATLHTLSPRPKVFITGAGITPEMSAEAIGVWEEYVGIVGLKALEVHVINLSQWKGSGKANWMVEIKNQLDSKFGEEYQSVPIHIAEQQHYNRM